MSKEKIISFGEHIRNLRKAEGLPLRKIAAGLDMDPSLLAKIERDERRPTKSQIKKLAKIFKQSEKVLLSESLSDHIAYAILEEDSPVDILKVAEEKVEYLKNRPKTRASKG